MWDLIVSVPDHCLSFYFDWEGILSLLKADVQNICLGPGESLSYLIMKLDQLVICQS